MSIAPNKRLYVGKNDTVTEYENNLVTLITASGDVYQSLEPRMLFPVSRLDEYICLLDNDGNEVAIIRKLSDLSKSSYDTVKRSLDDYYLVPHILKILSVTEKYGTLRWSVETDRGLIEFDIRNRNQDVKIYPDGRVRVRDSNDNRYVINDYRALDAHSRRQLIADL